MKTKKEKSLLVIVSFALLFSLGICPKIHAGSETVTYLILLDRLDWGGFHWEWAPGVHLCFDGAKKKYGHFSNLPAYRKNYSPLDDDGYPGRTWWTCFEDTFNRLDGKVTFEVFDKEYNTGRGFIDIRYNKKEGIAIYNHVFETYHCEYSTTVDDGNYYIILCIHKYGKQQNSIEEL